MADELKELLFPSSVAVVGASAREGKLGHELFSNVVNSFSGPVYAVNPGYEELLGRPCVSEISELPEAVDLAVIIIPAVHVPDALEECGRRGIGSAIVISGGFKETGGEGARLEARLVETANRYGINLLGPNCLGLISTQVGLNATFAPRGAREGDIAFLSQSGAFCTSVLDWAWKEQLGFSHFISLGNKAVLGEEDFLPSFAEDPRTEVVAAYLEGVSDGQRFLRVARDATVAKPVVLVKSGRAEAGARAVSSHTGSLAGSDRAYEAAFRQAGIIRAQNVEELFDFAYVLARQPVPKGRRVAIVSNAGGPGVMAVDAAELVGLEVARFTDDTARALGERMPEAASIYNPVDILGDARAERYREALRLVAADPQVDMIVALSAPTGILTYAELAQILAEARREYGKPITCSFMAGDLGERAYEMLREAGIPSAFDPARAVRALSALVRYADIRSASRSEVAEHEVDKPRATAVLSEAKRKDRVRLGVEAMDLLDAYGIAAAAGGMARSADEVQKLLPRLGDKVALKVVSPEMSHKSDVGGVKVGVPSEQAPEEALRMLNMARERFAEFPVDGVLVQENLPPGVEVIAGMVRDPTFGPLIMFGLGGIHVEVMGDVSFAVAPLTRHDAEELVRSIRAYPVLRGIRGQPGIDIERLVETLERLSQLALDFPEIVELEANPIMCYPDRVMAVDLRLTVSGEDE